MKLTPSERKEWTLGANNCKKGLSLSQSYKHLKNYEHDLRNANSAGWMAMRDFLELQDINNSFTLMVDS
jgi:hypothetical protein